MVKIKAVQKGSPAQKNGIVAGDYLLSLQGQKIRDFIDYLNLSSSREVEVEILKAKQQQSIKIKIKKGWQELGLQLENIIYDQLKKCHNKCIFCFVDQGNPQSRPTLKLKDDDYRFSFLQGSFITLNNLTTRDFKRIINDQLSPLYISVHTTDPQLRDYMMGGRKNNDILSQLQQLANHNLQFHLQIVLCPGINDQHHLDATIFDLAKLKDNILSLGIVPVGLTKFRENLVRLKNFDAEGANKTLQQISRWQQKFCKTMKRRIIFAADEFYYLSGLTPPQAPDYEDFPQLENGIGLSRLFWDQSSIALSKYQQTNSQSREDFAVVTSEMGAWVWQKIIKGLNQVNLNPKMIKVNNKYYGSKINVTGLLTAQDIMQALQDNKTPSLVFLPAVIFNEDNYTLDNKTIEEIQEAVPAVKIVVAHDLNDILTYLEGR